MKKIYSLIILLCFVIGAFPVGATDDNYFIVTAYYSPLPDQEYYITGNYEDELILNGKGVAGASGKSVFSGMLAAPGKYGFGTKIYLDGLGIGAVEDRGGAIVPAGQRGYSYDRIDVWMGYGDEGLLRANFWGKRKVYGYVIDTGNATTLDYNNVPAPKWATTGLQKTGNTNHQKIENSDLQSLQQETVFDISLGRGSNSTLITQMQDVFLELGYLEETSGEYDSNTISTVYDFQIEHEIVSSEQEAGAGSYGPKTRKKLKEVYTLYLDEKLKREESIKNIIEIQESSLSRAQQYVEDLKVPRYGDVSYEVRELQNTLTQLGYFDYKDTAIFGDITKKAILDYQIDNNIISSKNDIGAGVFGPKTRKQIIQDIHLMSLSEYLNENDLQQAYQDYLDTI